MKLPRALALPLLLGLSLAGCGGDSAETSKASAPVADGLSIDLDPPPGPVFSPVVTPNPSDIDTSWGTNGRLTLSDRTVNLTALDAQGRLLLTGRTATGAYVQRLLASGQPDPAFGTAGLVTLSVGDAAKSDYPLGLIPLEDGLLLAIEHDVVGSTSTAVDTLLRLDGDGAVVPYAEGVDALAFTDAVAVARDSRGRLYVLGSRVNATDVASLDPFIDLSAAGFPGPVNFSTIFFGQEIGYLGNRLFRLPGTITATPWTLTRYRADGTLDTGFGSGGVYSGTVDPAEALVLTGGDLPIVHYSHCTSTLCESGQAHFAADDSMSPVLLDSFVPGAQIELSAILPPDELSGTGNVLISRAYVSTTLTSADGSSVVADVPAGFPYRVAACPDGFIELFAIDGLALRKSLSPGVGDTGWNAGSAIRAGYSEAGGATVALTVAGDGGLFISGNTALFSNTYMTPTTPAEIVRVKGAALDTLPDTPASLPGSTLSGGVYQLAAPLLITGLGSNIAVPVRLSQGELSVDGGASWHSGWLWARNNASVLLRYPAIDPEQPGLAGRAVLTVGGTLAPSNPALPVGEVLAVSFSGGNASVITTTGTAAPASSGGSGGAADAALGVLLALLMLHRRRTSRAA
jgi:hypothetical protein